MVTTVIIVIVMVVLISSNRNGESNGKMETGVISGFKGLGSGHTAWSMAAW